MRQHLQSVFDFTVSMHVVYITRTHDMHLHAKQGLGDNEVHVHMCIEHAHIFLYIDMFTIDE